MADCEFDYIAWVLPIWQYEKSQRTNICRHYCFWSRSCGWKACLHVHCDTTLNVKKFFFHFWVQMSAFLSIQTSHFTMWKILVHVGISHNSNNTLFSEGDQLVTKPIFLESLIHTHIHTKGYLQSVRYIRCRWTWCKMIKVYNQCRLYMVNHRQIHT